MYSWSCTIHTGTKWTEPVFIWWTDAYQGNVQVEDLLSEQYRDLTKKDRDRVSTALLYSCPRVTPHKQRVGPKNICKRKLSNQAVIIEVNKFNKASVNTSVYDFLQNLSLSCCGIFCLYTWSELLPFAGGFPLHWITMQFSSGSGINFYFPFYLLLQWNFDQWPRRPCLYIVCIVLWENTIKPKILSEFELILTWNPCTLITIYTVPSKSPGINKYVQSYASIYKEKVIHVLSLTVRVCFT